MTQVAIQKQVDAIRKATEKASRSKEAAIRFLTEAGILTEDKKEKAGFRKSKDKK